MNTPSISILFSRPTTCNFFPSSSLYFHLFASLSVPASRPPGSNFCFSFCQPCQSFLPSFSLFISAVLFPHPSLHGRPCSQFTPPHFFIRCFCVIWVWRNSHCINSLSPFLPPRFQVVVFSLLLSTCFLSRLETQHSFYYTNTLFQWFTMKCSQTHSHIPCFCMVSHINPVPCVHVNVLLCFLSKLSYCFGIFFNPVKVFPDAKSRNLNRARSDNNTTFTPAALWDCTEAEWNFKP